MNIQPCFERKSLRGAGVFLAVAPPLLLLISSSKIKQCMMVSSAIPNIYMNIFEMKKAITATSTMMRYQSVTAFYSTKI